MTPPDARQAYFERAMRAVPLKKSRHQNELTRLVDYVYEPDFPALAALVAAPLGAMEEALEWIKKTTDVRTTGQIDTRYQDVWTSATQALAALPWKETP